MPVFQKKSGEVGEKEWASSSVDIYSSLNQFIQSNYKKKHTHTHTQWRTYQLSWNIKLKSIQITSKKHERRSWLLRPKAQYRHFRWSQNTVLSLWDQALQSGNVSGLLSWKLTRILSLIWCFKKLRSFKMLEIFYQTAEQAGSVIGCSRETVDAVVERRTMNALLSIMDNQDQPLHITLDRQRSVFSKRWRQFQELLPTQSIPPHPLWQKITF